LYSDCDRAFSERDKGEERWEQQEARLRRERDNSFGQRNKKRKREKKEKGRKREGKYV